MKAIVKVFTAIGVVTSIALVYSFGTGTDKDKTKKKTEKRVEVVEENGETKVTVTTIENGKKTVETFTGNEAEAYLKQSGNGNGNLHMSFNFDIDTLNGKNSFDFSMNGFGQDFEREMKQMIDELTKEFNTGGEEMERGMKEMQKSLDSIFSDENMRVFSYNFNNGMHQLDSMLNSGAFNFNFQFDDNDMQNVNPNDNKNTRNTVIVTRSVVIEDMDKKNNAEKNLHVSDISFYPNPTGGNFTLRYKSESMDRIDIGITDLTGKPVYNERISATGTILRTLELNEPSGTYLLTLTQGKHKTTKKLIIQ